jgi:hypothetical protein
VCLLLDKRKYLATGRDVSVETPVTQRIEYANLLSEEQAIYLFKIGAQCCRLQVDRVEDRVEERR